MGMVSFAKGHGTQNDFVILPDNLVDINLTESLVTALCDRQRGLGADGVLRVARAGALLESGVIETLPEGVLADDWFMDYRNSDGSIAEMCGNGVRVFAHYVAAVHSPESMRGDALRVGTRAGLREVRISELTDTRAVVSVGMGMPEVMGIGTAFLGADQDAQKFAGIGVNVGNPHLACVIPEMSPADLAALDLMGAGSHGRPVRSDDRMFPHGLNVEILTALDSTDAVSMRVIERGVGETRSCGTGTVAAAIAALIDAGRTDGAVTVKVPGGEVVVEVGKVDSVEASRTQQRADDRGSDSAAGVGADARSNRGAAFAATLTGPSVIHSRGSVDLAAL